ncbi:MAG: hypothetical protein IKP46_00400 [Bacteroidales bacterium]|nr:hypothetical protein [Bacteroidales bacterium]
MTEERRYKVIDCLRFFMAAVVVSVHTTDWSLCGLTDAAVPFFYVVSGFFLFLKMPGGAKDNRTRFRDWTLRALKMYLIWTAIYLPFTVLGFIRDGLTFRQCILVFFRNFFFVGENYLSWPLWYLLGLVWAGALYYVLASLKCPLWTILAVGILFFFVPWAFSGHPDSLFWKLFRDGRLFRAFLFISAGGAAGLLRIPPLPVKWTAWIPDSVASFLRESSAIIYLTHMIFAGLLIVFLHMEDGAALFCLSLSGSVVAAVTAISVRKRKHALKQ